MNELIITLKSIHEINLYTNADAFLIGNKSFCVRYNHSYSLEEIKQAKTICSVLNKKLYININRIFQENDLVELETFIKFLIEIDVDGIFFADYAVFKICQQYGVADKCIMYHETYPLNTNDIEILLSFGMKGLIISKEIELSTIIKASKFNNIGMTAFGHIEMFNSKRCFVDTYVRENKVMINPKDNYHLAIKEMTRDDLYPVFQDENGTNVFTSFVYSCLEDFKQLVECNIKYFIIDSIFLDSDYVLEVLNLFDDIRKGKQVDIKEFYAKSKCQLGSGFLHTDVGLTN